MSTDFQVVVHKEESTLHLKLRGDFDEDSAREVLKAVRKRSHATSRVFIHTNGLRQIHPEAKELFHGNNDFTKMQSIPVIFTGEKAEQLAPNGHILASPIHSSPNPDVGGPFNGQHHW